MFTSQLQAKDFFIERIVLQAQTDNISLSEAEKYMLRWTETEEGFEMDQKLIDRFNEETIDSEYEKKISNLIKHAYEADIKNDSQMKEKYQSAYKALRKGDHYILVMIDDAIGSKLKRWGIF